MGYEIAIINPRDKPKRRKRASAAQIAARRKFVAKFAKNRKARRASVKAKKSPNSGVSVMAKRRRRSSLKRNAKGHFVKRTHKAASRRRRRRNPRAVAKRRPAMGYTVGSRKIRRRKLNPRTRSRRRYHRNPIGLPSLSGLMAQIVPAAYGAGGAIALNLGLSYLPLPAVLTTGWARHGVRLVGAFGLGVVAKKFLGARGSNVAAGALTVVMYDILKEVLNMAAPSIGSRLGEFEDVSIYENGFIDPASPVRGLSAYLSGDPDNNNGVDGNLDGMGAFIEGNLDGVSDYNYV
jgi:hypothetical protein